MNILQGFGIRLNVLGFEIDDLAADHPIYGAGSFCDLCDYAHTRFRWALQLRERLVGLSLESISSEDCNRLTENFVARGPPSPKVVVVERRKVVVNQRIGMQHFECGAEICDSGWERTTDQPACLHAKNRPDALASGEHTVPHC